MKSRIATLSVVVVFALMLVLPKVCLAQAVEEKPTAMAMTGDLVIARPFLLAMTAVGTAIYIASLPLTLLGGNSAEAAEVLVIKPAAATFVRCLGCTRVGRKKIVDLAD